MLIVLVTGRIEIVDDADPIGPTVTVEKFDSYCCAAVTGELATKVYEPVPKAALVHWPFSSVTDVHWLTVIPPMGVPSTE